jgi:O-6-methylguanine DNA methyltransferase
MNTPRTLLRDLRALDDVRAPERLLPRVLDELDLGDAYTTLDSALGTLFVAFNRRGVSAVMLAGTPARFEDAFRARFGRPVRPAIAVPRGLLRRFDLRSLSEFERSVLLKAVEIPRGEVRTYAWIAREIGHPSAVRAVGSALRKNPVPVLIPCHRVVRTDGHIGDYALGGSAAKRRILAAEGLDPDELEAHARGGRRYVGSDTTRIYCFPTCRHARRVQPRHTVSFRSERVAQAAGYRPCKVCRPLAVA